MVFTAVSLLLCTATIASIATRLTTPVTVTGRTLSGSLAIYLLSGLAFAYAYSLIAAVREGGFFAQPGPHGPVSYLYFSFTTLTTVGFGDLTAGTTLAASWQSPKDCSVSSTWSPSSRSWSPTAGQAGDAAGHGWFLSGTGTSQGEQCQHHT